MIELEILILNIQSKILLFNGLLTVNLKDLINNLRHTIIYHSNQLTYYTFQNNITWVVS